MRGRLLVGLATALALGLTAVAVAAYAGKGDPQTSACGRIGDGRPVASPDGRRSAFVRCRPDGAAWLYVSGRGRSPARRLAPRRYNCCYRPSTSVVFRDPAWAPDGSRLAVVIQDVGGTDVWVLDADGRTARRVTAGPAREAEPRWSADGRRITFRTEVGATWAWVPVTRAPG